MTAFEIDDPTVVLPDPTGGGYDADVSQSIEDLPSAPKVPPHPSSNPSEPESELFVSDEASLPENSEEGDVFGPAAMAQPRTTRQRRRKPRPLSQAQSMSQRPGLLTGIWLIAC